MSYRYNGTSFTGEDHKVFIFGVSSAIVHLFSENYSRRYGQNLELNTRLVGVLDRMVFK